MLDLTGRKFGRLEVTGFAGYSRSRNSLWSCRCECGGYKPAVFGSALIVGQTASCGCLQKERAAEAKTTHGGTKTPTWQAWVGMRRRCLDTGDKNYPRYGGRGITVCERWRTSFAPFLADMGDRPAGLSLDRRDNNGPYAPDNCRWATPTEQARNRRSNRLVTRDGETKPLAAWVERIGISASVVDARIRSGWPEARWFDPVKAFNRHVPS